MKLSPKMEHTLLIGGGVVAALALIAIAANAAQAKPQSSPQPTPQPQPTPAPQLSQLTVTPSTPGGTQSVAVGSTITVAQMSSWSISNPTGFAAFAFPGVVQVDPTGSVFTFVAPGQLHLSWPATGGAGTVDLFINAS